MLGCPQDYVDAGGGTCFNEAAVLGMAITAIGGTAEAIGSAVGTFFGALRPSSGVANAAEDANDIHSVLDPIAYDMRTTAVLQTEEGPEIAAGGASHDLTPAQRARAAQLGI